MAAFSVTRTDRRLKVVVVVVVVVTMGVGAPPLGAPPDAMALGGLGAWAALPPPRLPPGAAVLAVPRPTVLVSLGPIELSLTASPLLKGPALPLP